MRSDPTVGVTTRQLVATLVVTVMIPLVAATGCPETESPQPKFGQVIKRTPRGTGVDLVIEFPDGKQQVKSYQTRQGLCIVGARWPDCAEH